MKKKIFAISGAIVVTASLLAGVTYAWFTNAQSVTPASITAGNLGIEFSVTDNADAVSPIYPQLTLTDVNGNEYPDTSGTISDVAEYDFALENVSDRQVLVKISGYDVVVTTPAPATTEETEGSPTVLDGNALRFNYIYDYNYVVEIGGNLYIYLDEDEQLEVTAQAWIDGATGGNEYQGAEIDFSEITAAAVQYRAAAIDDTFGTGVAEALQLAITDLPDYE